LEWFLNRKLTFIKAYQFELDKFYDHDTKTQEIYDKEIKDELSNNFGVFIYGHTESGNKIIKVYLI
jgi:hypothetical protein